MTTILPKIGQDKVVSDGPVFSLGLLNQYCRLKVGHFGREITLILLQVL